MDKNKIISAIYPVIRRLSENNYKELRQNNNMGKLSEEEIERVLKEYGGKLTLPQEKDLEEIYIYPCGEEEYIAETYMWIDNEQSDLTLVTRLKEVNKDQFSVSIEDLLVL